MNRVGRSGWLLGCIALGLVGCGRGAGTNYLPLRTGTEWTYRVRSGFDLRIELVRVTGPIAVAGGDGWQLNGPMGESRLAWREGVLLAEQLPGTRFAPAIPLLRVTDLSGKFWQGFVSANGHTQSAQADLRMVQESLMLAGRKRQALRSTVTLNLKPTALVLDSWFVADIGIVRQELRRGDALVRAMDWVAGP